MVVGAGGIAGTLVAAAVGVVGAGGVVAGGSDLYEVTLRTARAAEVAGRSFSVFRFEQERSGGLFFKQQRRRRRRRRR